METLSKLWAWFKSLTPCWLRWLVAVLVVALLTVMSFTSCGSVNRTIITTAGNDTVTVKTTTTKRDSSSVNIQVNPTLTVPSYGGVIGETSAP